MNGAITIGMRILVILGYLVGAAADSEAMSGETVGRVWLVLVVAVVAAFLFYGALRDSRRRLGRRPLSSVKG
jgi:membrane protein DedA with SNARE-associated domain